MCTYNGEKYLKDQLDSIVNQEHPIYELIIQGDGSTDKTIKSYRKRQKTKVWAFMYSYIYERTGEEHLPLVHKNSGLLLKTDVISFLKLCVVCLRYREKVYPQTEVGKGIMSYVRGFCFPLFWCYSNEHYFRDFN